MVGNLGVELLHHFVVLDVDDGGKWCDKGYLADLLDGEVFVFDLDDAFLAQLAAVEVVADKHLVFIFLETQDTDNLIDRFGGDMIDDGAVLNGTD